MDAKTEDKYKQLIVY